MVCWTFPNERKLGALPAMTDTRHLKNALLPEVVKAKWGDGWEIHEISPQVVCYFPEHTCSIKVQLQLKDKQEGTRKTWEIYGKTRYDDAGAKVIQHMETLWKSSSNDVRYACPVHYQPEHKLLWQEKVPGTTLDSMLGQDNLDGSLLESVARAVAGLHRTPLTNLRPYTIETIVDRLKIAVDICQSTRPDTAPVVRRAMSKLLEHVAALDTGTTATLHGDLHSNNILVDGQQTYLIDMDRLSSGPPLAELGSFLAEIIYRACLRGQPVPWWQLARIFESYRLAVPWPVGEWELEWYTAAALIHERIFRCLTSIKPGRMEIVHTLADIADQMAPGNPGLCLLDQCAVNG